MERGSRGHAMTATVKTRSVYRAQEARTKIEERKALWSPALQEKVTNEWNTLLADVEAALGEPVTNPKAQALAARWRKLVEGFTGGDPEVQKGLNKCGRQGELARRAAEAVRHQTRDSGLHYCGNEGPKDNGLRGFTGDAVMARTSPYPLSRLRSISGFVVRRASGERT
jgi:TipAS antibiotic-recognition domain